MGPWGPLLRKKFIVHPRNFFKNQNDVEFDFSIGQALVLLYFMNMVENVRWDHVTPPPAHPQN